MFRPATAFLVIILYVFITVIGMKEECGCEDSCDNALHINEVHEENCCSEALLTTTESQQPSDKETDHSCPCVERLNQMNLVTENKIAAISPRIMKKYTSTTNPCDTTRFDSLGVLHYFNKSPAPYPVNTISSSNTTVLLI